MYWSQKARGLPITRTSGARDQRTTPKNQDRCIVFVNCLLQNFMCVYYRMKPLELTLKFHSIYMLPYWRNLNILPLNQHKRPTAESWLSFCLYTSTFKNYFLFLSKMANIFQPPALEVYVLSNQNAYNKM